MNHNSDSGRLSPILLVAIPIILIVLLVSLIILLRRHQSQKLDTRPSSSGGSNINVNDQSCKFVTHAIITIAQSPDVKNGCISGGNSRGSIPDRLKGVQVFTYKELGFATDNFGEANVIGHGGYRVVYKGVLSDGTWVAIKKVHRDRKEGERAFRIKLITGRVPVDPRWPPGEHVLVSWALPRLTHREKVMEMVDPTLKGQYSQKDIIQIAAIAALCVQAEPEYRPLMTDIVQSLIPLVKNLSSIPSSRFLANMISPKSKRHSFS